MDIKKAYLFLIEVGTNLSLSRFSCFTTVDLLHDFVVAFDHLVLPAKMLGDTWDAWTTGA